MFDLNEYVLKRPASEVLYLCGAGISYTPPTCLPTVRTFVNGIVRHCVNDAQSREHIVTTISAQQFGRRFEVLVDEMTQLKNSVELRIGELFTSDTPNLIHHYLAERCQVGSTILTTNFDNCVELAGTVDAARIIFNGSDLIGTEPLTSVIVKPHGSIPFTPLEEATELVATVSALARTARGFEQYPKWQEYLLNLLRRKTIVVMGYSGSDDFDISPILMEASPKEIVWIDYDGDDYSLRQADLILAPPSVQSICNSAPSLYIRGACAYALSKYSALTTTNSATDPARRIDSWLCAHYESDQDKEELLNLLLIHYGLHKIVTDRMVRATSTEIHMQRSWSYYSQGQYKSAITELQPLQISGLSRKQKMKRSYFISISYYFLGNLKKAYQYGTDAYRMACDIGDEAEKQSTLLNLASIAFHEENYTNAKRLYLKASESEQCSHSLETEATVYFGLGCIEDMTDNKTDALRLYRSARDIFQKLGNFNTTIWLDANIGQILIALGDYEVALDILMNAKATFLDLDLAAGRIFASINISKIWYLKNNHLEAENELRQCIPNLEDDTGTLALVELLAIAFLLSVDTGSPTLLSEIRSSKSKYLKSQFIDPGSGDSRKLKQIGRYILTESEISQTALYEMCLKLIRDTKNRCETVTASLYSTE